jgi:hypothetical protein
MATNNNSSSTSSAVPVEVVQVGPTAPGASPMTVSSVPSFCTEEKDGIPFFSTAAGLKCVQLVKKSQHVVWTGGVLKVVNFSALATMWEKREVPSTYKGVQALLKHGQEIANEQDKATKNEKVVSYGVCRPCLNSTRSLHPSLVRLYKGAISNFNSHNKITQCYQKKVPTGSSSSASQASHGQQTMTSFVASAAKATANEAIQEIHRRVYIFFNDASIAVNNISNPKFYDLLETVHEYARLVPKKDLKLGNFKY